ncbi:MULTISPECIES: HAD family hydrolase [unclassified Luteococcus]|uniref:HAD family hydrolase n=1 Tax=unclassified Luteococcus TaxID=2639923 RepID=UPI00313B8109
MQTIIFDLGGVLVTETTQIRDAAKRLGVAPHQISGPYWACRDQWDIGCSNLDYWGPVAAGAGLEIDEPVAEDLARHDSHLWTTIRPAARQLLAELAERDQPVWLLSNAAAIFERAVDDSDWGQFLDGRFISGALRLMKPDPAIFQHVEQALQTPVAELFFIDDRPENIAVAADRGWQTHLWVSDEDTREWLVGIGALAG